jgi:hypothetical protein
LIVYISAKSESSVENENVSMSRLLQHNTIKSCSLILRSWVLEHIKVYVHTTSNNVRNAIHVLTLLRHSDPDGIFILFTIEQIFAKYSLSDNDYLIINEWGIPTKFKQINNILICIDKLWYGKWVILRLEVSGTGIKITVLCNICTFDTCIHTENNIIRLHWWFTGHL